MNPATRLARFLASFAPMQGDQGDLDPRRSQELMDEMRAAGMLT